MKHIRSCSISCCITTRGDNQSPKTDEEDINDNIDDAFELAGQLEVEEETDEESDHETTECRCRRLVSKLLKATDTI